MRQRSVHLPFFSSFCSETFIFLSCSSSLQFLRNSPFPFSSKLQYLRLSNHYF
ncbi:hypothetical protein HN51_045566 [Arachis hypogaea]